MSKETDLWMPIYIGDYLADTMHLTCEQSGAYLHLLMHYWRSGPPPADDAVLSSITRLKIARFRKHKSTLLSFFQVRDGKLVHKRADSEKTKAKQNAARRSDKASKAANTRWHGGDKDAPSNAPGNATSNAPECPIPSPSFSNEKGAGAPSFDAGKFVFSEGLALLVRCGSTPGAARTFLGKCRKDVGDERLAALLQEAERRNISDPKGWLSAACAKPDARDGLSAAVIDLQRRKAAQEAA